MSSKIIKKMALKEPISQKDLEGELFEICEANHSSCNPWCPIYEEVLTEEQQNSCACPYLRSGAKMLTALLPIWEKSKQ